MQTDDLIIWLFLALFALNVCSTLFISKRMEFSKEQKFFQILILWLIPYLGAIGILLLIVSLDVPAKKRQPFSGEVARHGVEMTKHGGGNAS